MHAEDKTPSLGDRRSCTTVPTLLPSNDHAPARVRGEQGGREKEMHAVFLCGCCDHPPTARGENRVACRCIAVVCAICDVCFVCAQPCSQCQHGDSPRPGRQVEAFNIQSSTASSIQYSGASSSSVFLGRRAERGPGSRVRAAVPSDDTHELHASTNTSCA